MGIKEVQPGVFKPLESTPGKVSQKEASQNVFNFKKQKDHEITSEKIHEGKQEYKGTKRRVFDPTLIRGVADDDEEIRKLEEETVFGALKRKKAMEEGYSGKAK